MAVGLAILFSVKLGNVPPLGKFLNPFTGFWRNAENLKQDTAQAFAINGLTDQVSILIDEQGVPHIFAKNEQDLYFAQGFVTAKDRLWQMDFQTRFAAGRLSEVVGESAIELDRYQRRMGMMHGAQAMLEKSMADPVSRLIMESYAQGVNAYIATLDPENYPIEFKILNYKPEEWTPLNSALLLKLMSATLARGTNELAMTNLLGQYGKDVIDDLYPNYPYKEDPIIPVGTEWSLNSRSDDNTPTGATYEITSAISPQDRQPWGAASWLLTSPKPENIGSNNWAVSGEKSSTGFPILANDPHLDMTLPSIWYQIQLHSPGVNVYGVSIPGAPNIIIGFNQNIAWGVTNVGSDVLDWYKIQFKDSTYTEYLFDNQWLKTTQKVEEIKIRNKAPLLDTVYYTHHGPVSYLEGTKPKEFAMVRNIPEGFALKWVAHLPSNELRTLYELNRATDYHGYREALIHFTAPAQNFAFADNRGDISITSNGLFPLKEKRQGKFLLAGDDPTDEWKKRIPYNENPTTKNPQRGFISSANQWPVDPSYPYYLGWEFAPYERGHRINNELSATTDASLESFKKLQTDDYSLLAENILDTLITITETVPGLNKLQLSSLDLLKKWDNRYDKNSIAASIFETWYTELYDLLWSDKFSNEKLIMRFPSRDRTIHLLLHEPESHWYHNNDKRTRRDVVIISFKTSIQKLNERYGSQENWAWGMVKKTHVPHLAAIKGMGSKFLSVGGAKHTVNAMSEKNGPSWRMIVLLGNEPRAYGIIPGGQSGNPGSPFYDNQISTWEKGELNELLFLKNDQSNQKGIISKIELITTPN